MNAIQQTALETAVLDRLHKLYFEKGFPSATSIRVLHRENSGAGRYVDIESDARLEMSDGYVDLSGSYIEMEGLPNGMMAVALIKNKRLTTLEFTVYGGASWDGKERQWKIV